MPPFFAFLPSVNTRNPDSAWDATELPRLWPQWALLTLMALIVAAPASTKIAGAAWLLVVLMGLWAALRIPVARPPGEFLVRSSKVWLRVCLVAIVLQAFPTLYWADPWGDRHAEVRLLLGAAAGFSIMRRLRLLPHQKTCLVHALALACCVALGVSYLHGRTTPSNAISWAAGVSFMVCVLIPQVLQPGTLHWQRFAWGTAVLAGTAAVLLSESRGSYGLVLWSIGLAGVAAVRFLLQCRFRQGGTDLKSKLSWLASAAVAIIFFTAVLGSFPRSYQIAVDRVQEAWSDIEKFNDPRLSQTQAINTSVGVRLHMWRLAISEIGKQPLLGYGRKVRVAWVHQLGVVEQSDFLKDLEHLHSDSLNSTFEHGLFGLASYLCFGGGLAWIASQRKYCTAALRWSLAGILWMHLTSGLTNVNLGHNYYGVMLALSLSLAWILAVDEPHQSLV